MKLNLRAKFLWTFGSLTVLIVVALMSASYWIASRAVQHQANAVMEQTVTRTATALDAWIGGQQREAQLFSTIELFKAACRGQRREEAQARLTGYQKLSPVYENIFLADTNGVLFVDAIGGKSVGIDLRKHPVFAVNLQKALQGEQWMSQAQASPATGRPVCLITTPIYAEGKLLGIVGTPIELKAFSDSFVGGISLGKRGYIAIIDERGIALAHRNADQVLKLNIADYEWGRRALAQKTGIIEYTFLDGPRVSHLATSAKKGWLIFAVQPKSDIVENLRAIRTAAILLGVGSIALVLCAVWLLTGGLVRSLHLIAKCLNAGAEHTAATSSQVSSSSQTLAEGASEQAAALEETSSSLEEMASMTRRNAENSQRANELARQTRDAAEKGAADMKQMSAAMDAIRTSSDGIAKIIKTIDEIALQTNILALNAAVEAARVGEAGKGFAVVAEEVRNLAMRSAHAAKETSAKIESAIARTGQGVEVSAKVAKAFEEILARARQVDELTAEVATASQGQSQGISEVNLAFSQMEKVTQGQAAGSEESAAVAQELKAQAESMRNSVEELLHLVGGNTQAASAKAAASPEPASPSAPKPMERLIYVHGNGHNGDGASAPEFQLAPARDLRPEPPGRAG